MKKWVVMGQLGGRLFQLGKFDSFEEADHWAKGVARGYVIKYGRYRTHVFELKSTFTAPTMKERAGGA